MPPCLIIVCTFLIAICCVSGCAPSNVKKHQAFNFSGLGNIKLAIANESTKNIPNNTAQQVIKNLQAWHYPVQEILTERYTHTLKATVGQIEHGSTPSGLSFSSGNSDPRSMEFQKADVLPVRCELTALQHPEQQSELSMGFTANEADRNNLEPTELADHISTVCFNLLREVKWPINTHKTDSHTTGSSQPDASQSSWIPEIEIETIEVPEKRKLPESTEQDAVEPEEPKKNIIIHNKGTPVILHFGHERR